MSRGYGPILAMPEYQAGLPIIASEVSESQGLSVSSVRAILRDMASDGLLVHGERGVFAKPRITPRDLLTQRWDHAERFQAEGCGCCDLQTTDQGGEGADADAGAAGVSILGEKTGGDEL